MADSSIQYAIQDTNAFIKLIGNISFAKVSYFDSFINKLGNNKNIKNILIDLSETKYIDSTNIGEIAKIGIILKKRENKYPTLYSSNPQITELLKNLGLTQIFLVVDTLEISPLELEEIPHITPNHRDGLIAMLHSHKHLVELDRKNEKAFENVLSTIENELSRNKDAS